MFEIRGSRAGSRRRRANTCSLCPYSYSDSNTRHTPHNVRALHPTQCMYLAPHTTYIPRTPPRNIVLTIAHTPCQLYYTVHSHNLLLFQFQHPATPSPPPPLIHRTLHNCNHTMYTPTINCSFTHFTISYTCSPSFYNVMVRQLCCNVATSLMIQDTTRLLTVFKFHSLQEKHQSFVMIL